MLVVTLLGCILWTAAEPIPQDQCQGVLFNGQYYDKEVLLDNVETIGQFSIDKTNNILLFSYGEDNVIKAGYLDLETKEFGEIKDVKGGFATAYDDVNDVVYIGGENGIYRFNPLTKKAEFYGVQNFSIWGLFVWDKLYFTDFPSNNIYEYNSGNPKIVAGFEGNFIKYGIVDHDGIFFVNTTGLYRSNNAFEVTDVYSRDDAYRFLCKDKSGNMFVGRKQTENEHFINVEVYKINKKEKNIERVALIEESVTDLAFDKHDNIIYDEADKIVKLKLKGMCAINRTN